MYQWDDAKQQANLAKHGVDFAEADFFDWAFAVTVEDIRRDYGERRLMSISRIGTRVFVLIWSPRDTGARLISLRKANRREIRRWMKERAKTKT